VRNCFDLIVLVGERESRQKPAFIVTAILLFCFYGYNLKKLRSEIGKRKRPQKKILKYCKSFVFGI
jgi:hypothetical protein